MNISESVVRFGADGTLVGVVSHPPGTSGQVGCLLLNTGVNHRMGPGRINVKVARTMAQLGIPTLRFDLSGIGDSLGSSGQIDFRQQALVDMRAALDQLQASSTATQFLVFGICSGADNGIRLAREDSRVIGLCMYDGDAFLSKRVRIERKIRRWTAFPFNPSIRRQFPAWCDFTDWLAAPADAHARQQFLGRLLGKDKQPGSENVDIFASNEPQCQPSDFSRDMNALVRKGVNLYLMYSAMIAPTDRGRDMVSGVADTEFLRHARYRFWPHIDHTVTQQHAQRDLLAELADWGSEIASARAGNVRAAQVPQAAVPWTAEVPPHTVQA